jgi:hypothetical protein
MAESIFSTFEIKLFGRRVADLALVQAVVADPPNPANPPPAAAPPNLPGRAQNHRRPHLNEQTNFDDSLLGQQVKGQGAGVAPPPLPTLARIYCFAYEGGLYQLPRPTIYIVHGRGINPDPATYSNSGNFAPPGVLTFADSTGVATREWFFEDDIVMWTYDKSHMSIRFDLTSGSFEDILLEATLSTMSGRGGDMTGRGGDMTGRGGDMTGRGGDMASRGGDMAARGGDMAFRARHRFR